MKSRLMISALVAAVLAVMLQSCSSEKTASSSNPLSDQAFSINGKSYTLSSTADPAEKDSVTIVDTVEGDINGDGVDDMVAILSFHEGSAENSYFMNTFVWVDSEGLKFVGEGFLGDRIEFVFAAVYAEGATSRLTGVAIHPDDYGQIVIGYYLQTDEQQLPEQSRIFITKHWRLSNGVLELMEDY